MFFYGKKIGYLSVYHNSEKVCPAGFVRMSRVSDKIHMSVQVKLTEKINESCSLFICAKKERILLGEIRLENGSGLFEKVMTGSAKEIEVNGKMVLLEVFDGLVMEVSPNTTVEVHWEQEERVKCVERAEDKEEDKEENKEKNKEENKEDGEMSEEDIEEEESEKIKAQIYAAEDYSEDKWEQLQRQFRQVHPFGDERVYIAIELKDFVILREEYQKLVHNSFLLHGFYNYRHLIVGRDCKMGNLYETCFYLGVPGVFYEKEKMVAVMFGFEGFECEGAVGIGKYGYYLRQIQI